MANISLIAIIIVLVIIIVVFATKESFDGVHMTEVPVPAPDCARVTMLEIFQQLSMLGTIYRVSAQHLDMPSYKGLINMKNSIERVEPTAANYRFIYYAFVNSNDLLQMIANRDPDTKKTIQQINRLVKILGKQLHV